MIDDLKAHFCSTNCDDTHHYTTEDNIKINLAANYHHEYLMITLW